MKHILVHIDASARCAVRLTLAQQLATRHDARLSAFYGVLPGLLASPWTSPEGMAAMAAELAEIDAEQRVRAQALVAQAAARSGQAVPHWVDGGDTPYRSLLAQAPYADLLLLGQHDDSDASTGAWPPGLVPDALCDTGRPTLIVPAGGSFEAPARRVLIAWKPSREAARALAASLPWLRQADRVEIALSAGQDGADDAVDHAAALRQWLQWQRVQAAVQVHRLAPGNVGAALVSLATDAGSDLLVMGCYGHSRAREWVLGGTTRTVLQTMTLPVLMAH